MMVAMLDAFKWVRRWRWTVAAALAVGVVIGLCVVHVSAPSAAARPQARAAAAPISVVIMRHISRVYSDKKCDDQEVSFEFGQPWITCVNSWATSCRPDPVFYTVLGDCWGHFLLAKHTSPNRYQDWSAHIHFHKWNGLVHRTTPTHWTHTGWHEGIRG